MVQDSSKMVQWKGKWWLLSFIWGISLCFLSFEKGKDKPGTQQKKTIAIEQIRGGWTCIYSVYYDEMLASEELPPWHKEWPETMLIQDDSLFEFHFPCELVNAVRIRFRNDSLLLFPEMKTGDPGNHDDRLVNRGYALSLQGDTLKFFAGNEKDSYVHREYVRSQPDPEKIKLLKKKTINSECLQKTWKLVTEYDSGYDGLGIVKIKFPFKIAHTLKLSPAEVKKRFRVPRILTIEVDGKPRLFYISSLENNNTLLKLGTLDWWENKYVVQYSR